MCYAGYIYIQNKKPPAGYLIYHLSRISRRPDNTDSRMAAGDNTPDISHIPGPASRTCHRHVTDRPVFFMSRGGGRGGGIRRRRPGWVQRRGGWKPASSGGGGSPVRGGGRRRHGARGVTESFRKTAGKPRENRVSGAGNPGFLSFSRRRRGAYPSHAGRRYARAGGGSGAGG